MTDVHSCDNIPLSPSCFGGTNLPRSLIRDIHCRSLSSSSTMVLDSDGKQSHTVEKCPSPHLELLLNPTAAESPGMIMFCLSQPPTSSADDYGMDEVFSAPNFNDNKMALSDPGLSLWEGGKPKASGFETIESPLKVAPWAPRLARGHTPEVAFSPLEAPLLSEEDIRSNWPLRPSLTCNKNRLRSLVLSEFEPEGSMSSRDVLEMGSSFTSTLMSGKSNLDPQLLRNFTTVLEAYLDVVKAG